MRSQIAVLISAVLVSTTLAAPTGADELGSLMPGHSRFWPGTYVDTARDGNPVFTDTLVTTDGGYRLRVGLDLLTDYREDGTEHESADQGRRFRVALLRDGVEILSGSNADGPWGYSVELFVCFETGAGCDPRPHGVPCTGVAGDDACDELGEPFNCDATSCPPPFTKLAVGPSTGTWTIKVTAEDVDGWSYRMRAGLERPPSPPDELADRYLSPNLRAVPPFELTLDCTSVQGSGAGVRTGVCGHEADAEAGSAAFTGCTALELAHNPDVRRCLRFSGGEEIAGALHPSDGGGGDLDIEGRDPVTDPLTGDITATAVQIRRAADGSIDEHTAGQLIFHNAHGHWHYEGFIEYQLFRVTGNTSADSPPNKKIISDKDLGAKRGWNPADERMADWSRFNQGINWAGSAPPPSPNCPSPCTPRLYQTVGWGDFYEWPVEEQFVPIGIEGDPLAVGGHYLLREVVDKRRQLIESDETDNTSYAYFEVTGLRSLRLIERGYGNDPWDPHKVVVP